MNCYQLTNHEVALKIAASLKAWRLSPDGANLTQVDLALKSGIGLTPLKRFEKTGAITLRNLIALLRAMELLEGIIGLAPDPDNNPGPLEILAAERKRLSQKRQRARRPKKQTIRSLPPL